MRTPVIVCDIDGVLSDDLWRRHFLPQAVGLVPANYDAYNERCAQDLPFKQNCDALLSLQDCGLDHRLVFCTARPQKYRKETLAWLNAFLPGCAAANKLLMRPDDDLRSSPVLKVNLIQSFLEGQGLQDSPVLVIDDRDDVIFSVCDQKWWMGFFWEPGNQPINPRSWLESLMPSFLDAHSKKSRSAADILQEAANTFRERNAVYKDNFRQVPQMVKVLFPQGVPPELVVDDRWHLFELILVKLSRAAISNLTHNDSFRDMAVYCAMIESLIEEAQQ